MLANAACASLSAGSMASAFSAADLAKGAISLAGFMPNTPLHVVVQRQTAISRSVIRVDGQGLVKVFFSAFAMLSGVRRTR